MTEDKEYWYRFDDQRWSITLDPEREIFGTELEVRESSFQVLRHTPKGVWLVGPNFEDIFVLKNPNGKRFAYATREDALRGYLARKNRQITIYSKRLEQALEFKNLALRKLGRITGEDIDLRILA